MQGTFLGFSPGTKASYSNIGIALLGHMVAENVRGSSFPQQLQERIAQPLGMNRTGITFTPAILEELAVGYSFGTPAPFTDFGYIDPAGGAYSTAGDLHKYVRALVGAWRGDSSAASSLGLRISDVRTALLPEVLLPDGSSYMGAPWESVFIRTSTTGGFWVTTKGGNVNGYTTFIVLVPSLDFSMVMALNGDSTAQLNQRILGNSILAQVLPALNATLTDNAVPVTASPVGTLSRVQGTYSTGPFVATVETVEPLATVGLQLTVSVGGGVVAQFSLAYWGAATTPTLASYRQVTFPPVKSCMSTALGSSDAVRVDFELPAGTEPATSIDLSSLSPGLVLPRA